MLYTCSTRSPKHHNDSVEGKTIVVTGSGNVAIYAVEKATQLGAKVVAMNDSNGYVYDPNGINLDVVKDIKEVQTWTYQRIRRPC